MNKHNQQGFTILAAVLAFVGLAVVLFIAWRIYDTYSQPQIQSTNNGQNANSNNNPTDQTDPNMGYTVITEWGVRFRPVEGLDGLAYKVTAGEDSISSANLSTTQIVAKLGEACGVSSDYSALGRIVRQPSVATVASGYAVKKQVGDYTYLYYTPQSGCSTDSSMDDELNSSLALMRSSIESLEAVK